MVFTNTTPDTMKKPPLYPGQERLIFFKKLKKEIIPLFVFKVALTRAFF
jgi:hypothetical protein